MLTDKEKKVVARYEGQMAMPKWKYILIIGVLSWGIATALLYTFISVIFFEKPFNEVVRKDLWINLATFMIAGIFFGLLMRRIIPRQIQKLKDKELL